MDIYVTYPSDTFAPKNLPKEHSIVILDSERIAMGDETVLTTIEIVKQKLKKYMALQEHGKVNIHFSFQLVSNRKFLSGERISTEITSFTSEFDINSSND